MVITLSLKVECHGVPCHPVPRKSHTLQLRVFPLNTFQAESNIWIRKSLTALTFTQTMATALSCLFHKGCGVMGFGVRCTDGWVVL